MNQMLVKMNMLWLLLTATLGLSNGANAAADYSAPPRCSGGGPGSGQAWIYSGLNYGGTCYVLNLGNSSGESWTSWDASTGFPNDQIQSVWVGPDVTLVLFWNSFNTKDNSVPLHFGPGQFSGNLGNWNHQASAARLQQFGFGQCGSNPNRLVLFTDPNFNRNGLNDCTELMEGSYPNPVAMGFRNDTLSSIGNNFSFAVTFALYINSNYKNSGRTLCPFVWDPTLAGDGVSQANANNFFDQLSSIDVGPNDLCSGF